MSKIIYVPLENIPSRYTEMMNKAIEPLVDIFLYPKIKIDTTIKRGQFLDIISTCKFKAAQLEMIADLFDRGSVESGDIFFVADIFFPGIESIKYMAELQGIEVSVYGINYAGRADKYDFVQKLGNWADYSEAGYHYICDGIFVGSEDHKKNVVAKFNYPADKVYVTGLIWDLNYMYDFADRIGQVEKEDFIIWPHRWANEKGINELLEYAQITDKKIIITSSSPAKDLDPLPGNVEYRPNLTKLEYYTLMAKAKWYLSTAYQETFGFTIQEAIFFNCNILVSDRACNPEMVPAKCIYSSLNEIDGKFNREDLTVPLEWTERWHDNAKTMINIIELG